MKYLQVLSSLILLATCFFFISFQSKKDKTQFYYAFGERIEVHEVNNTFLLKKASNKNNADFVNSIKSMLREEPLFEWQNQDYCKFTLRGSIKSKDHLTSLRSSDQIESASNFYSLNDGFEFGLTNEILVKFKDDVSKAEREALIKYHKLKVLKSTKIYESLNASKHDDVLAIANTLYETGKFEFAYPNLISKTERYSVIPNDPYFQFQVTLNNTGQAFNGHTGTIDADIDAPEAWDITMGDNDIIIAVFDDGVTSNHPDLPNTRQVRLNGSNFGAGSANDPSPTGDDNHGNSCAGVIAATANNNLGIAGIAPNSRIMPLRWDGTTTASELADGIEFAVDNGANIISNSWGFSTTNNNLHPVLVTAIEFAINNNVSVIFAAGNSACHNSCGNDGFVGFPANANVASLITVGASDRNDLQSDYSPTSNLIDIVAPSHQAYPPTAYNNPLSPCFGCGGITGETFEMWSIDVPGNNGYNPWPTGSITPPAVGTILPATGTNNLDFTGYFGGTSHSCPVVAGVAALVLSVDNSLTPAEIFNILTSTSDQIGVYTYTSGRSNETGHGRVNAFAAVQQACTVTNLSNQTITSNTIIEGCGDVEVENVTVTNNSKLTIEANQNVTIDGPFEVQLGSELEVKN